MAEGSPTLCRVVEVLDDRQARGRTILTRNLEASPRTVTEGRTASEPAAEWDTRGS
jgi:hypothetical protein